MERARAMHPFDTGEFDVAGRGRAGDQGNRARRAPGELGDSFGDGADNLIGAHDAEMSVRNQRERAAALALVLPPPQLQTLRSAPRRRERATSCSNVEGSTSLIGLSLLSLALRSSSSSSLSRRKLTTILMLQDSLT